MWKIGDIVLVEKKRDLAESLTIYLLARFLGSTQVGATDVYDMLVFANSDNDGHDYPVAVRHNTILSHIVLTDRMTLTEYSNLQIADIDPPNVPKFFIYPSVTGNNVPPKGLLTHLLGCWKETICKETKDYPRNNQGLANCAWCNKPTQILDTGFPGSKMNYCPVCKK